MRLQESPSELRRRSSQTRWILRTSLALRRELGSSRSLENRGEKDAAMIMRIRERLLEGRTSSDDKTAPCK